MNLTYFKRVAPGRDYIVAGSFFNHDWFHPFHASPQFKTHKVVYRRYAGLFFSMCIDTIDNELMSLEAIHLFVEILDHYFSNVCELDLVFNFHKVRFLKMNTPVQLFLWLLG